MNTLNVVHGELSHDAMGDRFIPGRLSNGHHGVFDTLLELYVVRNVAAAFATRVAERLNSPWTWEASEVQQVVERFAGWELNPEYVEIARRRIAAAREQLELLV